MADPLNKIVEAIKRIRENPPELAADIVEEASCLQEVEPNAGINDLVTQETGILHT